jgi:hypothetical protein
VYSCDTPSSFSGHSYSRRVYDWACGPRQRQEGLCAGDYRLCQKGHWSFEHIPDRSEPCSVLEEGSQSPPRRTQKPQRRFCRRARGASGQAHCGQPCGTVGSRARSGTLRQRPQLQPDAGRRGTQRSARWTCRRRLNRSWQALKLHPPPSTPAPPRPFTFCLPSLPLKTHGRHKSSLRALPRLCRPHLYRPPLHSLSRSNRGATESVGMRTCRRGLCSQ